MSDGVRWRRVSADSPTALGRMVGQRCRAAQIRIDSI
mgnify:CR=1 FL=1